MTYSMLFLKLLNPGALMIFQAEENKRCPPTLSETPSWSKRTHLENSSEKILWQFPLSLVNISFTVYQFLINLITGVAAQADANSANYNLINWNNTDSVDSEIENSLGSFGVGVSSSAMKLYNVSCNWSKYISMVSDIRTVCPINDLATNFTKLYSDSFVSFYVSKVKLIN